MASRRLRAFKRWMKAEGIECNDALNLVDSPEGGISVRALCDLKSGDVVAKIPKSACLTIRTSGAREMIESAGLDGCLGLCAALMYEKSLGEESPWAGYFQLLPHQEDLPLVWSLHEVDSLLCGTELHKVVKEDKDLTYEDWKESILPLIDSPLLKLDPKYFGVEDYLGAKSLIASRSFEIDDYYGHGMVPLADLGKHKACYTRMNYHSDFLIPAIQGITAVFAMISSFNHKTGAEDVHFTSALFHSESENEAEDTDDIHIHDDISNDEWPTQMSSFSEQALDEVPGENSDGIADTDSSSVSGNDPRVLEMIMVKDVQIESEVFNTYGTLGNAALLHRYGFTESNNPYDIVNIDLDLVLHWGSSTFSSRYTRARFSLWRRLDYSGCVSQNSEYFEISSNGEPQIELLILLYILLLPEEKYNKLDLAVSTGTVHTVIGVVSSGKQRITFDKISEMSKEVLHTKGVCKGLLELADQRESLYGPNSMDDDVEALKRACCIRERKLYHSLMLRVSERKILEKLRCYANGKDISFETKTAKRMCRRKK